MKVERPAQALPLPLIGRRPGGGRLTVFLMFAVACAPEPPPDRCARRIDAMAERLARAARHAEPADAPPDVPLIEGRGGVPLGGPLPLLVVGDEVSLEGRGVGGGDDVARIAETLRSDLALLAALHEGAFTIALWIDPDVEVGRLVDLLSGAPEGARFAILVRATDVRVRVPAWLRRMLARARDPIDRRERLLRSWERASDTCPSAALPSDLEPAPLVAALRECGCARTRLHTLEALATASLLGAQGPIARLPNELRFGPPSDDRPDVSFPRTTTARALAIPRDAVWITLE